jgi:hypothetical protein
MSLISNTGTLTISATALPSWVPTTLWTWAQIPNSNLSAIADATNYGNLGNSAKIFGWTSFALDPTTSTVWSVQQGGHSDWAGNSADKILLNTNSPGWVQARASTPQTQIPAGGQVRYYGDGRPCSHHTYYGQWFDTTRGASGRVMQFGGAWWDPNGGGWSGQVDAFDVATGDYMLNGAGAYPDVPSAIPGGAAPAFAMNQDSRNGNLYMWGAFTAGRWNRTANTMQVLSTSGTPAYGYAAASAFDSTRNRFLLLGGDDGGGTRANHLFTPDTLTYSSAGVNGSSGTTVIQAGKGGMHYIASEDAFFLRLSAAGGTVYRINASTFEATVQTTTGGGSIPAQFNGSGDSVGPYHKFLYVAALKSFVYWPSFTGNGWVLRAVA